MEVGLGTDEEDAYLSDDTDIAAYLCGSLSMSGSCAHCPLDCHPFEERETLMGIKGSSKGKFLLQAGPKVPEIKEIIVVLHLAYLCPFF